MNNSAPQNNARPNCRRVMGVVGVDSRRCVLPAHKYATAQITIMNVVQL